MRLEKADRSILIAIDCNVIPSRERCTAFLDRDDIAAVRLNVIAVILCASARKESTNTQFARQAAVFVNYVVNSGKIDDFE